MMNPGAVEHGAASRDIIVIYIAQLLGIEGISKSTQLQILPHAQ